MDRGRILKINSISNVRQAMSVNSGPHLKLSMNSCAKQVMGAPKAPLSTRAIFFHVQADTIAQKEVLLLLLSLLNVLLELHLRRVQRVSMTASVLAIKVSAGYPLTTATSHMMLTFACSNGHVGKLRRKTFKHRNFA